MKKILLFLVCFCFAWLTISYGMDKQERHECIVWYNADYPLVAWQTAQCLHHFHDYKAGTWYDEDGNVTGYADAEDSIITTK